jgi:type VI secretion system secreted protein Hcp
MAEADYFLKIEGIEGESLDKQHAKELEIESWSWGVTNAGSAGVGSGLGQGKASMQDFHFVVKNGKASPVLMERCASGKHIPTATLTCRKSAGDKKLDYLVIKFEELVISSFQTGGAGSSSVMEQISFNYTKAGMTFKKQKQDGSSDGEVKAGWDVKKNDKYTP